MSVLPPLAIEKTTSRPSGEKRGAKVMCVAGDQQPLLAGGDVVQQDARPAADVADIDQLVAARAEARGHHRVAADGQIAMVAAVANP